MSRLIDIHLRRALTVTTRARYSYVSNRKAVIWTAKWRVRQPCWTEVTYFISVRDGRTSDPEGLRCTPISMSQFMSAIQGRLKSLK